MRVKPLFFYFICFYTLLELPLYVSVRNKNFMRNERITTETAVAYDWISEPIFHVNPFYGTVTAIVKFSDHDDYGNLIMNRVQFDISDFKTRKENGSYVKG